MPATKESVKEVGHVEAPVEATPTPEAAATVPPQEEVKLLNFTERCKEDVYRSFANYANYRVEKVFAPIAKRLLEQKGIDIKMRKVFGDQFGHDILIAVFDALMHLATLPNDDGVNEITSVGIPGGYGSWQLTTAAATVKKTPQGKEIQVPKRWRVKYSCGKSIEDKLKTLTTPTQDAPAEEPEVTE